MHETLRLFNTVKHLKAKQILYRLFYTIRKNFREKRGFTYPISMNSNTAALSFIPVIPSYLSVENETFTFLNLSHRFDDKIDWNFSDFGKLWTYNLVYFDYLNQAEGSQDDGLRFINDFIDQFETVKDGMEPFPISLRGINWIKFLSKYKIKDQKIDDSLYAQYHILMDNLEYHLMGNHLLENGFSLLFGAYYYRDEKIYEKAKQILQYELDEQILEDGAHFEQSPMYHQIILVRLLDCINLLENNHWQENELLELLVHKASLMFEWLNTITFENGRIPLLNDSTNKVAPTTKELNDYASHLNKILARNLQQSSLEIKLDIQNKKLTDSGYRKVRKDLYECIVDVGGMKADYIPGHAHSDVFNFVLCVHGKPFISDTGTSTYEGTERRSTERSTRSHNTVEIEGLNQSDMWDIFRVANRADIIQLEETQNTMRAVHNGYKKRLSVLHQREFVFHEQNLKIIDTIKSDKKQHAIARFHFHPGIVPEIEGSGVRIGNSFIEFKSKTESPDFQIKIAAYQHALEYNKLQDAYMVEIHFIKQLITEIRFTDTPHINKQIFDYSKTAAVNDTTQKKFYLTFDIETIVSRLSGNPNFYSNILLGSLYIAEELERRGLKATFFISLSSKTNSISNKAHLEQMNLLLKLLSNFKNIKLQPHLHVLGLPLSFETSNDAFSSYTLEEQIEILKWGKQYFEKFDIEVDTFRPGSYKNNENYYLALQEAGYKYSSLLLSDIHINAVDDCFSPTEPFQAEHNIIEYPVTSVGINSIKNKYETVNLSPDFFTLDSMSKYIDQMNYVNLNFHSFSIFNNRLARENHPGQLGNNFKYFFFEKQIVKLLKQFEIETINKNTIFKDELIVWLDYLEKNNTQTFFIGE